MESLRLGGGGQCNLGRIGESSESWLASILAEFFHATVEVVGSSGVGGDELEVVAEYRRAR